MILFSTYKLVVFSKFRLFSNSTGSYNDFEIIKAQFMYGTKYTIQKKTYSPQ